MSEVAILIMAVCIICLVYILDKCDKLLKKQKYELEQKEVLLNRFDKMTDKLIDEVKNRDKIIDTLDKSIYVIKRSRL